MQDNCQYSRNHRVWHLNNGFQYGSQRLDISAFFFFSRIPGGMRFPRELAVQQHQNRNEIQLVIPEALADGSDAQDGKQTLTKSE